MGKMTPLFLPVHDLRGRNGQSPPTLSLQKKTHLKSHSVKKEIQLSIVVVIKEGRSVLNVIQYLS